MVKTISWYQNTIDLVSSTMSKAVPKSSTVHPQSHLTPTSPLIPPQITPSSQDGDINGICDDAAGAEQGHPQCSSRRPGLTSPARPRRPRKYRTQGCIVSGHVCMCREVGVTRIELTSAMVSAQWGSEGRSALETDGKRKAKLLVICTHGGASLAVQVPLPPHPGLLPFPPPWLPASSLSSFLSSHCPLLARSLARSFLPPSHPSLPTSLSLTRCSTCDLVLSLLHSRDVLLGNILLLCSVRTARLSN